MNKDIRGGRWLQLRGRIKMAWAWLTRDEALSAEGNADVVAGTLQESYGAAKKQTVREVTRGIEAIADVAKRTARALDK